MSIYSLRRKPMMDQTNKIALTSTNNKNNSNLSKKQLNNDENNPKRVSMRQNAKNSSGMSSTTKKLSVLSTKLKYQKNKQRCENESLDKASVLNKKRNSKLIYSKEVHHKMSTKIDSNIKSPKPTRVLRKRKAINKLPIDESIDSPLIPKKQKKINDPLAVYEFDYDPKDEPPKKNKRGIIYESDSSNDENNSMKNILRKLRTQERKRNIAVKKQKQVKQKTQKEQIINQKKVEQANTHIQPTEVNNDNSLINEMGQSGTKSNVGSDFEIFTDQISNNPETQARNLIDAVTKSFTEDISDEENNCSVNKNISDVVIPQTYDPKKTIFNSTIINPESHPWRLNVSTIHKKTPYFSYKDKSFTPCYDPEIITPDFIKTADKISNKPIEAKKKNYQSSILSYVQSTPLKENSSSNIPRFVNKKINSDASLFSCSFLSDEENKENVSPVKSPKKTKKSNKAILNKKQIVKEPVIETKTESANFDVTTVPLFEDVEEELQVSKKSARHYVRKHPKRKRLPSVNSVYSEDESENELPQKKKPKNVLTKKEEKEIDRLAAHYNSMFEEIEKYPLIIE